MYQIMHSMELDDEEKLDFNAPLPVDKPEFPYGLRITLTGDELAKLDLDQSGAFVGGIIHGHFLGRITCVRCDGDSSRVEVQIENLAIESEDAEDEDED